MRLETNETKGGKKTVCFEKGDVGDVVRVTKKVS